MKKVIFIIAIIGLVFSVSSCGNKKKKAATAGTHAHSDGTIHRDDAHDAKANQETFEVKADNDAEHKHADGDNDSAEHKHEHGDGEHDHDKDSEHKHAESDTDGHDHDSEHTHDDGTVHADHK